MHQKNAAEQFQIATLAAAAAVTATGNISGIDVTSYVGKAIVVLTSAAGAGTSPTLDTKLQESDTVSGTYSDIAGAAFAQVTGAAVALKLAIDIDAAKPFIRVVDTVGGTSPSFTRGVALLALKQDR